MKPTGPVKESTKELILLLEKHGKKNKQDIWIDIAKRIKKSRRSRAKINLWKLTKLAKKFKGKTMVVPGKILGDGEIDGILEVSALEFSQEAARKLKEKKCKYFSLEELVKKEVKSSSLGIVK